MLYFRVLGPLDVQRVEGETTAVELTRPLERRLLAVLLVADRALLADELIEVLWPVDCSANPERALQTSISRLRNILGITGPGSILSRSASGYRLVIDKQQTDAGRFEQLLKEAKALTLLDKVGHLEQALLLWRGSEAYPEFRYDDFARREAVRLEDLRLAAVEEYLDGHMSLGRSDQVILDLEMLIKEHPLREAFYGMLMLALYRTGRQAEALRVYQSARNLLSDELGIDPGRRLTELEEQILLQDPQLDLPNRPTAGPNNLPSKMNTIIGRADDLVVATQRLGGARLVTITGPGGVGKTTLAVDVARAVSDQYRDGCWLVALDAITHPDHVAETVAAALHRPLPAEADREESIRRLISQLSGAHVLLVVDNCEHVLDEAAHVIQRLLEACPGVSVLATSRERLAVPGEAVLPLAPLEVGTRVPMGVEPADAVARSPALSLFQDRGQAIDPTFSIGSSTIEVGVRICQRLDGLPLAIELAAAQLGVLSLTEIDDQLEHRFDLLRVERASSARHLTLEAAIEWSCQMLDPDHLRAIQRLATIATPFTAELAATVTGFGAPEMLGVLRTLRSKSLLQIRSGSSSETRYEFLQSIRAFARQRAAAEGLASGDMLAHAAAFRDLARRARLRTLDGAAQLRWLRLVEGAAADFEQAIDTCISIGDFEAAATICSDIGWVFLAYRYQELGTRLVAKVLEAAGDTVDRSVARVHLLAAGLMLMDGVGTDQESSGNKAVRDHLAVARDMAGRLNSRSVAIETTLWDGYHHWYMGEPRHAVEILVPIMDVALEHGFDRAVMFACLGIGGALNLDGAREEAIQHIQRGLGLAENLEDGLVQSWAYAWLASALRDTGDLAGAAAAYHNGFLVAARFGFPLYTTVGAAGEALSLWMAGDGEPAREAAVRAIALASSQPAADAHLSFQNLMADAELGMSQDELATRIRMIFRSEPIEQPDRLLELLLDLFERHAEHNRLDALVPAIDAALLRLEIPRATAL